MTWAYKEPIGEILPYSRYNEYKDIPYIHPLIKEILRVSPLVSFYYAESLSLDITDEGREFCSKLLKDVKQAKKVLVYGDFDIDGTTATSSMVRGLEWLGIHYTSWIIPDKSDTGHGLNVDIVKQVLSGYKPSDVVVITVDNGMGTVTEVNELVSLGYKLYITDHHLVEGDTPGCPYFDPKVLDITEEHPIYFASGCIVAILVIKEMLLQSGIQLTHDQLSYFDMLAGLSIVSDIIELTPAMYTLLDKGLVALQTTTHDGLNALLELCGRKDNQPITTLFLSYSVLPKINAACRMGKTKLAVNLFLHKTKNILDKQSAYLLASQLVELNKERKEIENKIMKEARDMATIQIEKTPHSLVLYKEDWYEGIVGIVAARIVEEFGLPTIILTQHGEDIAGSGRSRNISLFDAVNHCRDLLISGGGHKFACGIKLNKNNYPSLVAKFEEYCSTQNISDNIFIDAKATIDQLNDIRFQMELYNLEPHGKDNIEPRFLIENVQVISSELRKSAINMAIRDNNENVLVITKYEPPSHMICNINDRIDVIVYPAFSYFLGTTLINWKIEYINKHI